MKARFALLVLLPLVAVMISGCEKEKEDPSVTLGAQANTQYPDSIRFRWIRDIQ
jgi:hypothetical protein